MMPETSLQNRKKENLRWDTGQSALRRRGQRPGNTFLPVPRPLRSPCGSSGDPWPPAAQPSGWGTSRKGLPGLLTHRDEGGPFCTPRSHLRFQTTARPRSQSPAARPSPRRLRTKREVFHCPSCAGCRACHPEAAPSNFNYWTRSVISKGGMVMRIPKLGKGTCTNVQLWASFLYLILTLN